MNINQRRLIIASLLAISALSSIYSLHYKERCFVEYNGTLYLCGSPIPRELTPVITLSVDPASSLGPRPRTLRGLFPHEGLTVFEAAFSGLAFPAILVVAACYLLLGSLRSRGADNTSITARNQPPNSISAFPRASSPEIKGAPIRKQPDWGMALCQSATLALAVFPVLLVIDMPSMMLMTRLRFPRWVFALLVLRALGNASR